jgi:hypothetical protein
MIMLPANARPLSVACQQEQLVMWVQVPVGEDRQALGPLYPRIFVVVTTGDQYNDNGKAYIGSAELGKIKNEWFVAHVFEQLEKFVDPIDQRVPEDWAQIKDELQTNVE